MKMEFIIDAEKEYEEIKKTDVKNEVTEPVTPFEIKDVTPKNKKNGKTKKIIAIVSSVIVLICLAIGIWAIVEKNANKWEIKQNEVIVEYGEVYEPTIADFIDNEKYPNVTEDNTEIKVNATYAIDLQAENKPMAYYVVGDYYIDVIHKVEYKFFGATIFTMDETKKVNLSIKDTIAPVFAEDMPMELETYKDCEIENLEEKFKATDKATVDISIDKESIDYTTVGEYTTNVYAIDASGNIANKEIKIKVLEPSISINEPLIVNMTEGSTATLTATVKGKDQTVEWSSSDESIAKVENGTVTANKTGTVKITAKANGVETSCDITVTAKPTTSSNNNRSTSSSSNNNSSRPSSNGSNSSSSSNGGNSSSNNSTSATNGCASGNHSMGVGNIGKWFNNRSEVQAYVGSVMDNWSNKFHNGEITREEYYKNCPQGYKAWSCSQCGKWTGNFTY